MIAHTRHLYGFEPIQQNLERPREDYYVEDEALSDFGLDNDKDFLARK